MVAGRSSCGSSTTTRLVFDTSATGARRSAGAISSRPRTGPPAGVSSPTDPALPRQRRAVGEADVEGDPILPRDRPRNMSLPGRVLGQQDMARSEPQLPAVVQFDF